MPQGARWLCAGEGVRVEEGRGAIRLAPAQDRAFTPIAARCTPVGHSIVGISGLSVPITAIGQMGGGLYRAICQAP